MATTSIVWHPWDHAAALRDVMRDCEGLAETVRRYFAKVDDDGDGEEEPPRRKRANSTDSMYTVLTSVPTNPDADEIIFSASCYLHDRIVAGEEHLQELRDAGKEPPPLFCNEVRRDGPAQQIPDEDAIFEHLRPIYMKADFSSECFVVLLLYVERLFLTGGLPPLVSNWKAITFIGLVLAAKVWDDLGSSNGEFARAIQLFSLRDVNRMEAQFLSLMNYNVTVHSKAYTSCYFELRALCEVPEGEDGDSDAPLQPKGVLDAKRSEERSVELMRFERLHGLTPGSASVSPALRRSNSFSGSFTKSKSGTPLRPLAQLDGAGAAQTARGWSSPDRGRPPVSPPPK
jgi:hypothetical protein